MTFPYGSPQFGLDDAKIAEWEGVHTYGTAVDVFAVQRVEVTPQVVGGILEGDDTELDAHSRITAAEVRLRFGALSFEALEVLIGNASVESDTTPNRVNTLTISNENLPYFALCGRALSTQDDGDTHLFLPKVKITQPFTATMEMGQYVIPEVTARAVKESTLRGIFQIIRHETAMAVTIPPVYT